MRLSLNAFFLTTSLIGAISFVNTLELLGAIAEAGEFSYQVSIRYYGVHYCGGAIISENFVLTAAHCVSAIFNGVAKANSRKLYRIYVGSLNVFQKAMSTQVAKIYLNEWYNNYDGQELHDIALLKTKKSLVFNSNISPIALQKDEIHGPVNLTVSDWSQNSDEAIHLTKDLRFISLQSQNFSECSAFYGYCAEYYLCLHHSYGSGNCFGSGGQPAVVHDKLVGIGTSLNRDCHSGSPDTFIKIAPYYDWIKSIVKKK